MQRPEINIWHRPDEPRRPFPKLDGETIRASCSQIESAFDVALRLRVPREAAPRDAAPRDAAPEIRAATPVPTRRSDAAERLDEYEGREVDPGIVPLICRMPADCDDPSQALHELPEEIFQALDGAGREREIDPYPLATALHDLGLHLPAVALLERSIRRRGATLGACELMGKCLLGLGRPDLALLWFLRPLRDPELEFDTLFELARQASTCQMKMQLAPANERPGESSAEHPAKAA